MAGSPLQHNIGEGHGAVPVAVDMGHDGHVVGSLHTDLHAGCLPHSSAASHLTQQVAEHITITPVCCRLDRHHCVLLSQRQMVKQ